MAEAGVSCTCQTTVLLPYQHDVWEAFEKVRGTLIRAVIDDDDLVCSMRLCKDTAQCICKKLCVVEGCDDHGNTFFRRWSANRLKNSWRAAVHR